MGIDMIPLCNSTTQHVWENSFDLQAVTTELHYVTNGKVSFPFVVQQYVLTKLPLLLFGYDEISEQHAIDDALSQIYQASLARKWHFTNEGMAIMIVEL